MMMFHETANGRKSALGEAIRTALDLQSKITPLIPVYIFEAPDLNMLVQTSPPPFGFTYLMVDRASKVFFINGADSMLGPNAAEILAWVRTAYEEGNKTENG